MKMVKSDSPAGSIKMSKVKKNGIETKFHNNKKNAKRNSLNGNLTRIFAGNSGIGAVNCPV